MILKKKSTKTVIITGSSGLLGFELSKRLINDGYIVVGLDKKRTNYNHENFYFIECNLKDERKISSSFNKINKRFNVSCLINNAAIDHKVENNKKYNFINHQINDWKKTMAINLDAVFLTSKHVCKIFEKKKVGNIINVSSTYGLVAPNNNIYKFKKSFKKNLDYPTSKSAIIGFTKSLASYYSNTKIRVNCICPGGIFNNQNKKFVKEYSKNTIIGRMAKIDEITNAIVFLISEQSSYMTGSILTVDGGWTTI